MAQTVPVTIHRRVFTGDCDKIIDGLGYNVKLIRKGAPCKDAFEFLWSYMKPDTTMISIESALDKNGNYTGISVFDGHPTSMSKGSKNAWKFESLSETPYSLFQRNDQQRTTATGIGANGADEGRYFCYKLEAGSRLPNGFQLHWDQENGSPVCKYKGYKDPSQHLVLSNVAHGALYLPNPTDFQIGSNSNFHMRDSVHCDANLTGLLGPDWKFCCAFTMAAAEPPEIIPKPDAFGQLILTALAKVAASDAYYEDRSERAVRVLDAIIEKPQSIELTNVKLLSSDQRDCILHACEVYEESCQDDPDRLKELEIITKAFGIETI